MEGSDVDCLQIHSSWSFSDENTLLLSFRLLSVGTIYWHFISCCVQSVLYLFEFYNSWLTVLPSNLISEIGWVIYWHMHSTVWFVQGLESGACIYHHYLVLQDVLRDSEDHDVGPAIAHFFNCFFGNCQATAAVKGTPNGVQSRAQKKVHHYWLSFIPSPQWPLLMCFVLLILSASMLIPGLRIPLLHMHRLSCTHSQ